MKLKKGFVLRQINKRYYAVPVGPLAARHKILISMNGTCLFVWQQLHQDRTRQELLDAILAEYDVALEVAAADLDRFLGALEQAGLLEK